MRWAQGFGYGGVGPLLYGVLTLPGFWAFPILGVRVQSGGDREKDITMKPVVTFKAVRKRLSKDHPPFVILHQQKLIYISKEAGDVLDISNPAWPLHQSPTKLVNMRKSLPVVSSNWSNETLTLIQHFRSHLHHSRLLRYYLQLNKPEMARYARWALRELIPQAAKQKKAQHFTRNGLRVMGLVGKKRNRYIRQVLVAPGGIEVKLESRISGIDGKSNPGQGGETCRKR